MESHQGVRGVYNLPDGGGICEVARYVAWSKSGKKAALHMYSKGGHGFGIKTQNLPVDTWIQRFYEWALAEKIVVPHHQP
jgi:hypothetical protein